MAELYSYTEGPEFQLAQSAFEETAKNSKEMPKTWNTMTTEQRCSMIQTLLDRTEVASRYDKVHIMQFTTLDLRNLHSTFDQKFVFLCFPPNFEFSVLVRQAI